MKLKEMLIWALRRQQTRALIRQMADTSSQLEKFNAMWADAIENVPFYAEWAKQHHLPMQIADLKELNDWPILEKQELIRNREKLVREWVRGENGERVRVKRWHESVTGGSTGEPLHFRTMPSETDDVAINKWVGWARVGIYPDSRCFLLWGHRHFYGQGWASNLKFKIRQFKDWLTNNKRADATDLTLAALRKDYVMMRKFNPECIIAYSASLLALVRTMREEGLGRRPRSTVEGNDFPALRAIICTAGPLTKEERGEIADFFGVSVSMEYGSMECGVMAYQTPRTEERYKVFDQTHIFHAGDKEGERQEILITALAKRYLPLIRYRIGDYMSDAHVRDDGTIDAFAEVSGRTGDLIDLGNGVRFHGYSLMVCAEENPKIVAYQLRVNAGVPRITFIAQVTAALTEVEKRQIIRHGADVAHIPQEVMVVEESVVLAKAPSGKIQLVIFE